MRCLSQGAVAALLLIVSLAGCAEQAPVQSDDLPEGVGEELQATETTGVIRGIVVDVTITPIEGATVSIKGQEKSTITDENGFFGFEGLEPQSYFLDVSKDGWKSAQASTTVVAGDAKPPLVRVQLEEDPATLPYSIPLKFEGIIQCSFSLIAVGYAACANVGDRFLQNYESDAVGGSMDYVQSEMIWKSTQAAGDRMTLLHSAPGEGALLTNYGQAKGVSPLVIRNNATTLEQYNVPDGYPLQLRIFNAPIEGTDVGETFGDPRDGDNCIERPVLSGCTTGLGATLDQTFVVYTHVFHNYLPDPEWQFSVDGDPEY